MCPVVHTRLPQVSLNLVSKGAILLYFNFRNVDSREMTVNNSFTLLSTVKIRQCQKDFFKINIWQENASGRLNIIFFNSNDKF